MLSIEYIAAFIDGEGSFKASQGTKRTPCIEIANTDENVLNEISESIESITGLKPSPLFKYKKYKEHHRQSYGLYIGAPILRFLLPFLISELRIKVFQAETMLELISIKGRVGCKGDPETRELKNMLTDKIQWANQGYP